MVPAEAVEPSKDSRVGQDEAKQGEAKQSKAKETMVGRIK
jgi:hypothetical protein